MFSSLNVFYRRSWVWPRLRSFRQSSGLRGRVAPLPRWLPSAWLCLKGLCLLIKTPEWNQSQQNKRVTGIPNQMPRLLSLYWSGTVHGESWFRERELLPKHVHLDWCDLGSVSGWEAETGKVPQPGIFSQLELQRCWTPPRPRAPYQKFTSCQNQTGPAWRRRTSN